mgnify:CR=1 FL=1
MAHFAEINSSTGEVIRVLHVDDADTSTDGGLEQESIGIAHLEKYHGGTWKQCSYNTINGSHVKGGTAFRLNYPGKGWFYSTVKDVFYPPRPVDINGKTCNSWTIDIEKGEWNPPHTAPTTSGKAYAWNEAIWEGNDSEGWVESTKNVGGS